MTRASCICVSHGGGPLPVLGDPSQAALAHSMRTRVPDVLRLSSAERRPKAIVLLSAHWENEVATISAGAKPSLLYDFGGFPAAAYKLQYPAPSSPEVAARVQQALASAGIASRLDVRRGWDHGVFVPMLLIRPEADVPLVQMSVLASQDPKDLYALGRALAPLRDENIAIMGSGFPSMHNFGLLSRAAGLDAMRKATKAYPSWQKSLRDALRESNPDVRGKKLEAWRGWEGAYLMHPPNRSEHFSPLIVCAGAAGESRAQSWTDIMTDWEIETFYWE